MYLPTIGLEIHAELKTQTKMFCNSRNDPDEMRPNVNVCPVCMGHPGTLPVINKEAVRHVLKVGLLLGGTLADFTEFDRKNYFYPDIPKGYQISQYQYPLVTGGSLNDVLITRVHLEEDTATLIHADTDTQMHADGNQRNPRSYQRESASLVDFNRAGVPLMELVTEPVIHSAKEAGDFARELQLLLRYLNASDANMEKGEMRVEANISVRTEIADGRRPDANSRGKVSVSQRGSLRLSAPLGIKVEVKNLNSFRAVERAIAYEVLRQSALLEAGERVVQETRGWDEATQRTFSQRRKEESHDYRYFPDPDLPKLYVGRISEFSPDALRKEMPELPALKRVRFASAYGVKEGDAKILVSSRALGTLFEEAAKILKDPHRIQLASNYLTSDLMGLLRAAGTDSDRAIFNFTPQAFAELVGMVASKKLSSRGAKDLLAVLFERGGLPEELAKELGLPQKSGEEELAHVVSEIILANPKVALDYRNGKAAAMQFLVGQGMKATRGSGNPEVLRELLTAALR